MNETTLKQSIQYNGMGLHTGTQSTITLRPAPEGHGVAFRRIDMAEDAIIPATVDHVSRTDRCTTLQRGEAVVSTVEHLLSALRGMEIDNVMIDIDGPEVPIADGSARLFVDLIRQAGIERQSRPRQILTIERPVWVRMDNKVAVALPYEGFKVSLSFTNDHGHPVLGDLFSEMELDRDVFVQGIAPARTIGWLAEVEALKARGLAQGATMDMAVVISEDEVLTPMRFDNEPARHKVLDIIGDVSLAGYVHAHIIAIRSSHQLNVKLAKDLVAKGVLA